MSVKHLLLLVPAAIALGAATAAADTAVPIRGDRTTGYPILADNGNPNFASAMMFLYTRDELQALPPDALITGLELDKVSDATTGPGAGSIEIYLANSTDTSGMLATLAMHKTGATLVYSSTSQRVPATQGWWSPGVFNGSAFTYTGQTLKVIVVWNGSNLGAMRSYNRHRIGFGGQAAGSKALSTSNTLPIADSAQLFGGQSRPNVRLTFTPPNVPYLVMSVGDSTITPGATYQNASAFTRNVATPQNVVIKNAGGATADLSAGFTFTNQTNINNATVTPAPASLAAGAFASAGWSHTPIAGGAASYTVAIGGFSFTQQGTAGTSPQTNAIGLIRDVDGRSHDPGYSGTAREVLVNASEVFGFRVINTSTATITSVALPADMVNNMVASCDVANVTIPPGEHRDIPCTATVPAAGSGSTRFLLTVNGLALSFVYLSRTAFNPTTPPPDPTPAPEIDVEYMTNGSTDRYGVNNGQTIDRLNMTSDSVTVIITNLGDAPLVVEYVDAICTGCTHVILQVTEGTIAPGASITASFAWAGYAEELAIAVSSNDDDEDPFEVTFRYPPMPDLKASVVTEDLTSAGESIVEVELTNAGRATLQVNQLTLGDADGGSASVDGSPFALEPGETRIVNVMVTAIRAAERFEVDLTIGSTDPDQPNTVLSLGFDIPSANGGGGCSLSASDGGSDLGTFLLGVLGAIALRPRRRRATVGAA